MTGPVLEGGRSAQQHRKILRCRAVLQVSQDVELVVRTIDISSAGVCIMSQQSLAVGLACRIVFQLSAGGRLHDVGAGVTVLYNTCQGTDGFRLGLRFADIDPARAKLIDSLH